MPERSAPASARPQCTYSCRRKTKQEACRKASLRGGAERADAVLGGGTAADGQMLLRATPHGPCCSMPTCLPCSMTQLQSTSGNQGIHQPAQQPAWRRSRAPGMRRPSSRSCRACICRPAASRGRSRSRIAAGAPPARATARAAPAPTHPCRRWQEEDHGGGNGNARHRATSTRLGGRQGV